MHLEMILDYKGILKMKIYWFKGVTTAMHRQAAQWATM